MDKIDKQRLLHYYKEALDAYGDHDARSVHWSDKEGQQARFIVLSHIANLLNQSVLDVGCGLGDLYKFFLEHSITTIYTGIDIMPDFVSRAREYFPEAHFELKDIFAVNEMYDYVLASGALSFKVADNQNYYLSMIKKMFDITKKGLAFNMLNKATHVDDAIYAAYDINEITDFCKTLSPDVQITVGYLPQDFTVYMYRNSASQ